MKPNIRKVLFGGIPLVAAVVTFFTPYPLLSVALLLVIGSAFMLNRKIKFEAYYGGGGGRGYHGRNFKCLVLGSTKVWKHIDKNSIDNPGLISFAFYKRTLYSDFLILKHKFSYLQENGSVLITIDCESLQTCTSGKIRFPDIVLFHRITLKSLGINRSVFQFTSLFPLLFYPIHSLRIVFAKICDIPTFSKRKTEISEQTQMHIIALVLEMVEFCRQRELVPTLAFINYKNNRQDILNLKSAITSKYSSLNSYLLDSADQLREII